MAGGAVDKSSDSVIDGVKKIFGQLANLKLAPDAQQHMQFITIMEKAIMGYLQQASQQASQSAQQMAGGPPGQPGQPSPMGGGAGGGDMGAPPSAQQIAPGGGGGMSGFGSPNPDELRRVLSSGAQ